MDAEVTDIDDARPEEKEYDIHKFAKMMLIAAASFVVGKGIENAYDAWREHRDNSHDADILEIE